MARFTRFLIIVLFFICNPVFAQDSSYARQIIRTLSGPGMYGRGMQNRGDSIAAGFLCAELKKNGVKPLGNNYYQHFRFPNTIDRPPIVEAGYRSQNVIGYIPGESDSMIVFTAHYDHLGIHGDTIFPGAHDNASGVAAVMDLARMRNLNRGYYTYVFIFFGGEEAGLVGSRFFADVPLIKMNKVKLLLNIDMMCGGDEGIMFVNANDHTTAPFVDFIQRTNDERNYVAKVGRRNNAPNSDHYYFSFFCPAVFMYTLGGPYGGYHNPQDTCDGCGLGNYNNIMTLLRIMLEQMELTCSPQ